jgi:hypothetical protein
MDKNSERALSVRIEFFFLVVIFSIKIGLMGLSHEFRSLKVMLLYRSVQGEVSLVVFKIF